MIKAVIFDFYGVLLADTHKERLVKLRQESPEKADEFASINSAADKGILSHEESRRRMAELMGISYEQLLYDYADGEVPNEELISFIENDLKPKYRVGILSNSTGRDQLDMRFDEGRLDAIFDEVVSSGELGFVKPQPEVYIHTATKLGFLPEECIMVDDIEAFCQGARDVGMKAVRLESTAQAIQDLKTILRSAL